MAKRGRPKKGEERPKQESKPPEPPQGQALLMGKIPEISALRALGLKAADIAKHLGVSLATLKRFCRSCPDLQEVCASQAYRVEYVQTQLFLDFKTGALSERGKLKYYEILLNSQLLKLKKHLLEIEAALRLNGLLAPDDRLEIEGITEADIDSVMQSLSRRGERETGDRGLYEGKSDYADHYEVVPKNNAIG